MAKGKLNWADDSLENEPMDDPPVQEVGAYPQTGDTDMRYLYLKIEGGSWGGVVVWKGLPLISTKFELKVLMVKTNREGVRVRLYQKGPAFSKVSELVDFFFWLVPLVRNIHDAKDG